MCLVERIPLLEVKIGESERHH